MAQKNNIRSIRFTDELAELIERQVGRTFTEKFENLVTRCIWELPKKEEELRYLQERIDKKRSDLTQIDLQVHKYQDELQTLEYGMRQIRNSIARAQKIGT